ncbi:methyltransferase CmcJ [Cadophora sp. MPI-SDFR-AT-0126]|nr:methyltransferase CmcJ [Leotiomycetes sp. MPI-SDFR-AT-0126]
MKRVSLHAEEEINRFKNEGWRVRIVNTWRPITSQVSDWPLALCDARSVSNAELIAVDHVRRRYVGESYYMPFNAAHRWYYLSRQTKDEVLLFKNYDSREDLDGKYCPHASFRQSNGDPMATPRCSIEVRALVFSEQ